MYLRYLSVVISVAGLIPNIISLSYFLIRKNRKSLPSQLLVILNTCDLLLCVTNPFDVFLPRLSWSERIFNMLSSWAVLASAYTTTVLSITRGLAMLFPFSIIRVSWIWMSFVVFMPLFLLQEFLYVLLS